MKKHMILACVVALIALTPAVFSQSPAADDPEFHDFVDIEIRSEMLGFIQSAPAETLAATLRRATQCQALEQLLQANRSLLDELRDTKTQEEAPNGLTSVASAASEGTCRMWMSNADSCWREHADCVNRNAGGDWKSECDHIKERCEMWEGLVDDFCRPAWPPTY